MNQDKGWNRSKQCLPIAALLALALIGPACVFGSDTIECSSGIRCPANSQCSADGTACITGLCGNGQLNPPEVCDDGNDLDGDNCSADCSRSGLCGNDKLDPGEVCDDGNEDSGDGCRSDCRSEEVCGNDLVDVGEACDDGNQVAGDNCTPDCRLESCGNGIMDPGEKCDDGNTVAGDGCNHLCVSNEECGNGYIDDVRPDDKPAEECDDGTGSEDGSGGSDICNGDCTVPRCGDRHVNPATGEDCDDGPEGSPTCNVNCKVASCGDRFVNPLAPNADPLDPDGVEVCDSGGVDSLTCDSDCTVPFCGDGHPNTLADNTGTPSVRDDQEECDKGSENTADCNFNCTTPRCGDGIANLAAENTATDDPDDFELCDDGGDTANCDADCTLAECGDGVENLEAEECESYGVESAMCTADCKLSACGDAYTNFTAAEACDTAGMSATCDVDCTLPRCGDGIVNPENGEACDSGGVNTLDCNFDCTFPVCRDGILNQEANEDCDIANGGNNDPCRNTCRLATQGQGRCGNGSMSGFDRFKQCDDGRDGDDDDECTEDCTFGPAVIFDNGAREGQECEPMLDGLFACDADHTFRICGDGFINRTAGEQCDDGNLTTTDDCSACVLTRCGDGERGPYEQCDDGNRLPGDGCSADCQKECGNGRINAGEQCDDGNLVNDDACTNDCTFGLTTVVLDDDEREGQECVPALDGVEVCDPDHTFAKCGDGFINAVLGEECDDGNALSRDGCSADCEIECGDGNRDRFEQCDDGNLDDEDACKNDCTFGPAAIPGNGIRDIDGECELGLGDVCDADRTFVECGDGVTNTAATLNEECDDGNQFAGDGCSADCTDELCGNDLIEGVEQCDGGAAGTCNSNCTFGPLVIFDDDTRQGAECEPALDEVCDPDHTFVRCGDRFVSAPGEQCDDGNTAPGDGCSPDCQFECGDDRLDVSEQCDDGNQDAGDGCGSACLLEECGNGFMDPGEECDDGNTVAGDGCDPTCVFEPADSPAADSGDGNHTAARQLSRAGARARLEPSPAALPGAAFPRGTRQPSPRLFPTFHFGNS